MIFMFQIFRLWGKICGFVRASQGEGEEQEGAENDNEKQPAIVVAFFAAKQQLSVLVPNSISVQSLSY